MSNETKSLILWPLISSEKKNILKIISISWLLYCPRVLKDITTGGKWMKGTRDPPILFLTAACESTIILK